MRNDVTIAVQLEAKLTGFRQLFRPQRLREGRDSVHVTIQISPPQVDLPRLQFEWAVRRLPRGEARHQQGWTSVGDSGGSQLASIGALPAVACCSRCVLAYCPGTHSTTDRAGEVAGLVSDEAGRNAGESRYPSLRFGLPPATSAPLACRDFVELGGLGCLPDQPRNKPPGGLLTERSGLPAAVRYWTVGPLLMIDPLLAAFTCRL